MSRCFKLSLLALSSASLLCIAEPAFASASFPEALRKELKLKELPYAPLGCQLCHTDDKGGYSTATKPFGRSIRKAGATGGSVPSMLSALAALDSSGTDSDHDGTSDVDELKAGADPNVAMTVDGTPPPAFDEVPLPETGCALAGSQQAHVSWFAVALAACGLAGWRRRIRRFRVRSR